MRINHTQRAHAYNRQTKKPHRRLLFAGLFSMILLLVCIYGLVSFGKDTSIPSVETGSSKTTLAEDVWLAWPEVGEAAIGSVEGGLLARSSVNEGQRPMASMAKVITALAIMEKQSFELGQTGQTYTLTSKDVAYYHSEVARGGSTIPVYVGMVLTQYEAMQMMLVASGNNIADTLVERTFGSKEAYVSYAHDMLRRMGLSRTDITDASGFNPATVSTPSELVTIGIAALKNPVIAEIVTQQQAVIPGVGTITNTNELLGADSVVGIKTGTTNEAGSCLLFAARYSTEDRQKVTIVGVIMGDTKATIFSNSRNLLVSARRGLNLVETRPTSSVVSPSLVHENRVPQQ